MCRLKSTIWTQFQAKIQGILILECEVQITDAFIIDFVQQEPLVLDVFYLFVTHDKMLVYDLDSELLVGIFLASQDHLSKTTIAKSSYKLKVREGKSNPGRAEWRSKSRITRIYLWLDQPTLVH